MSINPQPPPLLDIRLSLPANACHAGGSGVPFHRAARSPANQPDEHPVFPGKS